MLQVTLWTAYLKVMLDLQQRFGAHLPNAEFVWHTIDRPVRLTNASAGARDNYPVFRFGKSAAHPDILSERRGECVPGWVGGGSIERDGG